MSKADDVFDRVVDVHSTKIPKSDLEDMFKKCGPVNNMFHWKGGHDKPHMLVEYASLTSAKSARALSNDKSGLQVIRAYNNDGLIRKFKDLCRTHIQNKITASPRVNQTPKGTPKGPTRSRPTRSRSRSRSPLASITRRRIRSRDTNGFRRPLSLSPRRESPAKKPRHSPESRWQSLKSPSEPVKPSLAIATSHPQPLSSEKNDWSRLKDLKLLTATPMSNNDSSPKPINIPTSATSVLRIPYAGEIIQMDLSNQLGENPIGIITILTATEAAQQLWMIVAAHYNSLNNQTSARKVLEAGIDLSIRLGRTDTRPFWYLLDQMNSAKNSQDTFNSLQSADIPSTNLQTAINPATGKTKGKPSFDQFLKSLACESQKNPTSYSSTKGEISRETQNLIDKLHAENKSLRSKYHDLLDDLAEARAGKRRADDEVKEERAVRRKLERELKLAEDALKRSKRMEQTALDQFKTEVEFRRKAEVLLADMKAQQPRLESQQSVLLQLISLIQNATPSTKEHCLSSGSDCRTKDPRVSQAPGASSQEICAAQ